MMKLEGITNMIVALLLALPFAFLFGWFMFPFPHKVLITAVEMAAFILLVNLGLALLLSGGKEHSSELGGS